MQGAEVEVCKGFLLLGGEAEGFGGRRQDWLELGELTIEVADVHGLFDWRQERWCDFLGQQSFPINSLKETTKSMMVSCFIQPVLTDVHIQCNLEQNTYIYTHNDIKLK